MKNPNRYKEYKRRNVREEIDVTKVIEVMEGGGMEERETVL